MGLSADDRAVCRTVLFVIGTSADKFSLTFARVLRCIKFECIKMGCLHPESLFGIRDRLPSCHGVSWV